jgi:hypothetical protein
MVHGETGDFEPVVGSESKDPYSAVHDVVLDLVGNDSRPAKIRDRPECCTVIVWPA